MKLCDFFRYLVSMEQKEQPTSQDFTNFEFEFNKTARNKYENPYLETAKRMTGIKLLYLYTFKRMTSVKPPYLETAKRMTGMKTAISGYSSAMTSMKPVSGDS